MRYATGTPAKSSVQRMTAISPRFSQTKKNRKDDFNQVLSRKSAPHFFRSTSLVQSESDRKIDLSARCKNKSTPQIRRFQWRMDEMPPLSGRESPGTS